jgi:hypothetical protein
VVQDIELFPSFHEEALGSLEGKGGKLCKPVQWIDSIITGSINVPINPKITYNK